MLGKTGKLIAALCVCGFVFAMTPDQVKAEVTYSTGEVGVETSSSYIAKIDAPSVKIYDSMNERSSVVGRLEQGAVYDVLNYQNGWVKVNSDNGVGYLKAAGQATVVETTREVVDEEVILREDVVRYALQFVGNPYVYGGTDPNKGADCSGFTSYVMRHAADIALSHSSVAQSGEGQAVSVSDIKPGDLIFYSNGSRINHVGIYMGNGQIVHASTEKTGIKTSRWNYRTPVKVVDVLS